MRSIKTKVMKLNLITLLVVMSLLSGCIHVKSNKVGLLIHQQDDRWKMDIHYLSEMFSKEGIDFVIKDAHGDENLQIKQARELINEGVDVILIVAVNQNTAASIVRMAHEEDVPVVGYDRMIKNTELDYLLSFQYAEIGKKLAEYAHQKVPKGNYVLFWGDAFDDNALEMQKAQMEYLKPYIQNGDIKIVYKAYIEDWKFENAKSTMEKILDFNQDSIDVVLANNDRIAAAVIESLQQYRYPKKVLVTGHDATLEACQLIAEGKQSMTIYKPLKDLAHEAVMLCKKIDNREKITITQSKFNGRVDVKSILLSPIVVDIHNLKETVIKDGLHTREEIYR